jgi:hypothetical protein
VTEFPFTDEVPDEEECADCYHGQTEHSDGVGECMAPDCDCDGFR